MANRVQGLREFKGRCRSEPRRLRRVAKLAAREVGERIRAAVEAETPVDTGFARTQVEVRDVKGGVEVGFWGDDFDGVFYPAIVHYGRAGVPENPFAERALNAIEAECYASLHVMISAGLELGA